MRIDESTIMWSAPERERANRPLLVLLHGKGSHEGDLFALAPRLPLEPVIASLRAPLRDGEGFGWFEATGYDGNGPTLQNADNAADAVLDWLSGVRYTSVGLLGFSQGAALTLQLMRVAPSTFTYGVALSGFSVQGNHSGDIELERLRPPVFWGRGTRDMVITAGAIERTIDWLPQHAILTERIYESVGHSISDTELSDVSAFIRANGGFGSRGA